MDWDVAENFFLEMLKIVVVGQGHSATIPLAVCRFVNNIKAIF